MAELEVWVSMVRSVRLAGWDPAFDIDPSEHSIHDAFHMKATHCTPSPPLSTCLQDCQMTPANLPYASGDWRLVLLENLNLVHGQHEAPAKVDGAP